MRVFAARRDGEEGEAGFDGRPVREVPLTDQVDDATASCKPRGGAKRDDGCSRGLQIQSWHHDAAKRQREEGVRADEPVNLEVRASVRRLGAGQRRGYIPTASATRAGPQSRPCCSMCPSWTAAAAPRRPPGRHRPTAPSFPSHRRVHLDRGAPVAFCIHPRSLRWCSPSTTLGRRLRRRWPSRMRRRRRGGL